jgi:uncharacterized protein (DUF1778 family)
MSFSVLTVQLSDEERVLLEAASSQAHMTLSDFVRRKALEAAEIDTPEERFEAGGRRPAREVVSLRDLAKRPPTWRK